MPEAEGYVGILRLLTDAIALMEDGEAKTLVLRARAETAKLARQSVTSLEMGMDLGRLLAKEEREDKDGSIG